MRQGSQSGRYITRRPVSPLDFALSTHPGTAVPSPVATAFLSMVVEDFERRGTIMEKYDVVRRTSAIEGTFAFGYGSNEVGFGWTNGGALMFLTRLDSPP